MKIKMRPREKLGYEKQGMGKPGMGKFQFACPWQLSGKLERTPV